MELHELLCDEELDVEEYAREDEVGAARHQWLYLLRSFLIVMSSEFWE
jgi:hypothetical protein